jgi:hypothetical protein
MFDKVESAFVDDLRSSSGRVDPVLLVKRMHMEFDRLESMLLEDSDRKRVRHDLEGLLSRASRLCSELK